MSMGISPDFTPGFAINMDTLQLIVEIYDGYLADIVLALPSRVLYAGSKPVQALRSTCDVMLAILGHTRLDGYPLPTPHPFTQQLVRALHDPTGAMIRELPAFRPLPPRTGQDAPWSADVFPKWYLDAHVAEPDWVPFDAGAHICNHYSRLVNSQNPTNVPTGTQPSPLESSSARNSASDVVRTAAECQKRLQDIEKDLSVLEGDVQDILRGAQRIWDEDYRVYRDVHDRWQNIKSPE
ncbi:unnamed protein product [Peniophora sp. CBMAI 1063]|nr:unnamed protein product [Peniophora sp. CBMAI 1063]